jgi:hypothetical protein
LASMPEGWFPMPRFPSGADNNPFYGDAMTRALFLHLCEEARFKDAFRMLRNQKVTLVAGELCTSQDDVAAALGTGRQTVRRCMDKLVRFGLIDVSSTAMGTIIAIPHLVAHYAECAKRKHGDNAKSNQAKDLVANQAGESANADGSSAPEPEDLVGNQPKCLWTNQVPTKRQPDKEQRGKKGDKSHTPYSPPQDGGQVDGKSFATQLAVSVERAIRQKLPEPSAQEQIGKLGWRCLMFKYGDSWSACVEDFAERYRTGTFRGVSRHYRTEFAPLVSTLAAELGNELGEGGC